MTKYEVIKELTKREKKQGIAIFADEHYHFDDIYYMMMDAPEGSDNKMLLSDDFEERMGELCRDKYEYDKFMRILLPEEDLVQWG
jgi:hypothetical protein